MRYKKPVVALIVIAAAGAPAAAQPARGQE